MGSSISSAERGPSYSFLLSTIDGDIISSRPLMGAFYSRVWEHGSNEKASNGWQVHNIQVDKEIYGKIETGR